MADIAEVGERRELACNRLAELAWNLAGHLGLVWDTASTLDSGGPHHNDPSLVVGVLLGWSQWLTCECRLVSGTRIGEFTSERFKVQEIKPLRSRWLLKNALARFQELETAGEDLGVFKISMGSVFIASSLFLFDSRSADNTVHPRLWMLKSPRDSTPPRLFRRF